MFELGLPEQEMLEMVFIGVRGGDSFTVITAQNKEVAFTYVHFFCFVLFPCRRLVFGHRNMDLIGAISATRVVITCRFQRLSSPGRTLFGQLG